MNCEIKLKLMSKIKNSDPILILIFLFILIRPAAAETNGALHLIDLPTALRLAGAQNLDVQIASEKLREAQAIHQSALAQFFPWIAPGITYHQHDNKIQDVQGNIIDVHKYSYAPGVALAAQVELGDTIYQSLASKQLSHAAGHGLEAQRQQGVLAAAQGYFELALAQGAAAVARESVRIATGYEEQVSRAVAAGIAFKGDALRARVQQERNELGLRQVLEQQRIAAARLAQTLRLDPAVVLTAQESELTPLTLITNCTLDSLVAQALAGNPELKQSAALTAAARDRKSGATYGPLIPTLSATAFFGGLGGGRDGVADTFGGQQSYMVGASWRLGPGGLFDFSRIRATEARLKISELDDRKLKDELTRQVVEGFTRWQSQADQIQTTRSTLAAAAEGFQLAQQRKEFAVGMVLETIQAEQDLTRARLDYLKAVAEFNRAQYGLSKLTGALATPK
jgi:outer membrane protein TolC